MPFIARKTYSCYVIDDELDSVKHIEDYISRMPELILEGSDVNPLCALEKIRQGSKPDIVFLDINMLELSGLSVAKMLPPDIAVIFVTAHPKYALQAFQLDAMDYLLKPFGFDVFAKSIHKVISLLKNNAPLKYDAKTDSIFVNSGTKGKIVQIEIKEITHIEVMDHVISIHTQDNVYVTKISMKEILERLPSHNFVRIHRSFLINLNYVHSISRNQIVLSTGNIVPFGEAYRKDLMTTINHMTIKGSL